MNSAIRDTAPSGAAQLGADPWKQRVDAGDWQAIAAELDSHGGALLPQLLTADEAEHIRGLYDQAGNFRSTVNMGLKCLKLNFRHYLTITSEAP
jgi:hypothetical protein